MHRPLLAFLFCVLAPHAASQPIFRCATDGGLVLQQGPCHGGQDIRERMLSTPTAARPPTGPTSGPTAAPVPRQLPVRPSAVDRTKPVAVASR